MKIQNNNLTTICLFVFFLLIIPFSLLAQRDFSKVEIKPQKVTETVYMLTGSGGNIGLCVGEDGLYMIDSQFGPLSEKIMTAIASIKDAPIKYLINTHWHGDHVGGNENFNRKGAIIVAHENVRKRVSTEQHNKAFNRTTPPSPEGAWPSITFTDDIHFHANGEDMLIFHVHNAHTDGDAMVYFTQSNVLHMGDTFFSGRYPYIDLGSGGTINGIIAAANKALFVIDDDTKIIPGHGPLSTKADLKMYRDVLMIARDRVKKAIKAGQTIEEIKAAKLNSDYDEAWGSGFINAETFVDIIFTDLTRDER